MRGPCRRGAPGAAQRASPTRADLRCPTPTNSVEDGGFSSIGLGMMSLINLGLGLGLNDYGYTCNLGHEVWGACPGWGGGRGGAADGATGVCQRG